MDAQFNDMLDGFRRAAEGIAVTQEGLLAAGRGLAMTNEGFERAAAAAIQANREGGDMRETIARLEALVMDLATESRALRDEVRALRLEKDGGAT